MTSELFQTVDHVGIAVRDIDRALAEYSETLGLQVVHNEVLKDLGLRLAYLGLNNLEIQLVAPIQPEGFIHDHLESHGEGLHHICFAVDNIPAALRRLGEHGTDIFTGGKRRRVCFLRSTPGNVLIELTETAEIPAKGRSQ